MAVVRLSRPLTITRCFEAENLRRDVTPVRARMIRIQQTQIGRDHGFVVLSQRFAIGCTSCDRG